MAARQNYYRPPRPQYPSKGAKPVARQPTPQQPPQVQQKAQAPRPRSPPIPWFIGTGIGFTVLLITSIIVSYYSVVFQYFLLISYILFILATLLVACSIFGTVLFIRDHRTEDPRWNKIMTLSIVGILVGGSVVSAVLFVSLEPYHDWKYSARLECPTSCIVDLPVPVKSQDHNVTFFEEKDLSTKGQGFVELVGRYPFNKTVPALRVHWSGNFSIKASGTKDYRDIYVGRSGLYDSASKEFLAYGVSVPSEDNVTFRLEFSHQKISQRPYNDHWVIQGKIEQGTNYYSIVKD